jgi:hypothetical protein
MGFYAKNNFQENLKMCQKEIDEKGILLDLPAYQILIAHYTLKKNLSEV